MTNNHIKQGKSLFEIVRDVKVTEFKAQLESGSIISVLCTCTQVLKSDILLFSNIIIRKTSESDRTLVSCHLI